MKAFDVDGHEAHQLYELSLESAGAALMGKER